MIDLERLLELIDRGLWGITCGCSVTTRAYLRLAETELFERMREASGRDAAKLNAAYGHYAFLRQKEKTHKGELQLMSSFWTGYDDGQHERTLPTRVRGAYKRGYHFGRRDT